MNIQKFQIEQDFKKFKFGLEKQVDSLISYVDAFACDSDLISYEDVRFRLHKDIKNLILSKVIAPEDQEANENCPFYAKSIKKLWNKINKKVI